MNIKVTRTALDEVKAMRVVFLHENNFQFVFDKCHYYGWADTYLFEIDGVKVGYGAVWGKNSRADRDSIMEFFVINPFRRFCNLLFEEFIKTSGALYIECQSNDHLLHGMIYEYAEQIYAEAILFEDHIQTALIVEGAKFGRIETGNTNPSDADGYFIEFNGEHVATGGFMLNYNMPYADIYMDVKEPYRSKGFGSLIIQELKKEIYQRGRVPAARCNINNFASKATLTKAGFRICGFRLNGVIKNVSVSVRPIAAKPTDQ